MTVPRDLADRLLEHLDPIRCNPTRILELGAATGYLRSAIEARYPKAQLVSADDCHAVLTRIGRRKWRLRRPPLLCCSSAALPLPSASVDLLIGNQVPLLCPSPGRVFAEWRRVMRHGGLVLLSSLGPLSFHELARAWAQVDPRPRIHPYPDMHDLGDALVRAGFDDVVVDSQRLSAEFEDLEQLMWELRTVGGGNSMPGRSRGLTTPRMLERVTRAYREELPSADCRATVEAVFAHAWVMERAGTPVAAPVRDRRSTHA